MARAIKLSVVVARRGPVGSRRDHHGLTSGRQRLKYASIGVERLVGDERIGLPILKLSVVVARRGPVGSRRDHHGLTSGRQRLKYASIGVERLVGDQRIGL